MGLASAHSFLGEKGLVREIRAEGRGGAGEGREQVRPRQTLASGESQQTVLR